MTFWPPAALLHDYLGGLLVIYGSIIYLGKGYGARVFKDIDILIFGLIHGFLLENHMIIHHYILKKNCLSFKY